MKQVILPFAVLMGLCVAGPAGAANLAQRQLRQQARIHQGVTQGGLTRGEAVRLQKHRDRIHRSIRRDRRDGGGLTPLERWKANLKLDRQSRRIARARQR